MHAEVKYLTWRNPFTFRHGHISNRQKTCNGNDYIILVYSGRECQELD